MKAMRKKYFGIPYQFDKESIKQDIEHLVQTNGKGYVCVADGVTLAMSQNNPQLRTILDHAFLVVCDSGWVPLYLKALYGIEKEQYSGTELMGDLTRNKSYKIMFLGASEEILCALKENLANIDERLVGMPFVSLPFCQVEDFDYTQIAAQINGENPDIIFVSLGMPKQEIFMYNLEPLINRGVLLGVGAAFKFHSGLAGLKRAPHWMIRIHLEWLHRIWSEPGKQINRCILILKTLPVIFLKEYKLKKADKNEP